MPRRPDWLAQIGSELDVGAPVELRASALTLRCDPAHARLLIEDANGPRELDLDGSAPIRLHVSRSRRERPCRWLPFIPWRASSHWLHVELGDRSRRWTLSAEHRDASRLEGLPWKDEDGLEVEPDELRAFTRALVEAGAELSVWSPDETVPPAERRERLLVEDEVSGDVDEREGEEHLESSPERDSTSKPARSADEPAVTIDLSASKNRADDDAGSGIRLLLSIAFLYLPAGLFAIVGSGLAMGIYFLLTEAPPAADAVPLWTRALGAAAGGFFAASYTTSNARADAPEIGEPGMILYPLFGVWLALGFEWFDGWLPVVAALPVLVSVHFAAAKRYLATHR